MWKGLEFHESRKLISPRYRAREAGRIREMKRQSREVMVMPQNTSQGLNTSPSKVIVSCKKIIKAYCSRKRQIFISVLYSGLR